MQHFHGRTTGEPSEYVIFTDPLIDGTLGTPLGGSFGPEGWTVTADTDRVFWKVPRLIEGSVAFSMKNVTLGNLPLNDHEVFAMYEGGYDVEHPVGYNPGFRNNAFKSMIRIYGVAEGDRVGKQKIMWHMCPFGAPGYHDGTCPCTQPAGFFEEPFGGETGRGTARRSASRSRGATASPVTTATTSRCCRSTGPPPGSASARSRCTSRSATPARRRSTPPACTVIEIVAGFRAGLRRQASRRTGDALPAITSSTTPPWLGGAGLTF